MTTESAGRTAWKMVVVAFFAQNCAMGLTVGSFGQVLGVLENRLEVSRAAASGALSVMYLAIGLFSPAVGQLLARYSVRRVMIAGALLDSAGYALLAFADDYLLVVAIFALLIGPGASLLGIVAVSTLVSRWFDKDRGKALGMANMSLFLLFVPPLAAQIAGLGGPSALFGVLAAIFLTLIPWLRGIVEAPPSTGMPAKDEQIPAATTASATATARALLSDTRLWLLSLCIGVMSATATTFAVHSVQIAASKGIDVMAGSMLVSFFGAGALIGAVLFGWMSDRIGALPSLAINTACQSASWLTLSYADGVMTLLTVALLIGVCAGAQVALHSAALGAIFGQENMSRAMGLSYFLKVPFMFGGAPLAGFLFDVTKDYWSTYLTSAVALLAATLIFVTLAFRAASIRERRAL